MKKLFTLVIFCFSPYLFAQLNGTYTIGASGSDYTTVQLAVSALTTNGVSGPVVFNIKTGSYQVFQLYINAISGASSTNSITFQSENLDANSVILKGCKMTVYAQGVIFNKLKLDVYQVSSTANSNAFSIVGNNCSIIDCVFINGFCEYEAIYTNDKATKSYIIVYGSDLTISNNNFQNTPGCCIYGSNNASICNNLIITGNFFNGSNVNSIDLYSVNSLTVSNNTFSSATINSSIFGINITGTSLIEKNKIYNNYNSEQRSDESTIQLTAVTPTATSVANLIIRNNFISSKSQNLRIRNFKNCKVVNNNFKSTYNCIYIEPNSFTASYIVENNIFYSTGTWAMNFPQSTFDSSVTTDYNAYSNNITPIRRSSSLYYSLANWQSSTGREMHSMISDLVYASATDLHTPNAFVLDNAGVSFSDVITDIDGETRNTTTPDIGADEFNMDYSNFRDLEIVNIFSPAQTDCNISTIILNVKNNGAAIVDSFDIQAIVNDYPSNLSSYTTPINPGETIPITFTALNLITNNFYEKIAFVVSNPNHLLDNNFSNNVKILSNYTVLGDFPIVVEKDNCGAYKSLTIPMSGNTILWSTGQSTNKIYITGGGTYSVTVTKSADCTYTKSITLN